MKPLRRACLLLPCIYCKIKQCVETGHSFVTFFFLFTGLVALPDGISNVETKLTTLLSIQVTVVIGPLCRNIDVPRSNLLFDFLSYISLGNSFRRPVRNVPSLYHAILHIQLNSSPSLLGVGVGRVIPYSSLLHTLPFYTLGAVVKPNKIINNNNYIHTRHTHYQVQQIHFTALHYTTLHISRKYLIYHEFVSYKSHLNK